MSSRAGKEKNKNCTWCKLCLKEFEDIDIEFDKENEHICYNCKIKQEDKDYYLYWCSKCNVPVKSNESLICDNCGTSLHQVSRDLRPVFSRERKILLYFNIIDEYQLYYSNIWRSPKNPYCYVDGSSKSFPSMNQLWNHANKIERFINTEKTSTYEQIDEYIFKKYKETAKLNSSAIRSLENQAGEFLNKLYFQKYSGWPLVISFSGGKDSTVIVDLVKKQLGLVQLDVIFNNTTLEHPQTLKYVKKFAEGNSLSFLDVEDKTDYSVRGNFFYQVTPKSNFSRLVKEVGPPSRGVRWCCSIFKTSGINDCIQEWGNKVLTIYGIRNNESVNRSHYCPVTEQAKIGMQVTASPIISWLDFDVWMYIFKHEIMFNELYRYGYSRVGCWMCPVNSNWSDFLTRIYFPEKFFAWREFLINYAKNELGKPDPIDYVDSGNWKKRFGGAGRANRFKGIENMPCGEKENAIQYKLKKPIDKERFYEYFKPFGTLDFEKGRKALGEFYIAVKSIIKKYVKQIIVEAIPDDNVVRVTFVNPRHIELISAYVKYQLIKYEMCIQCTACEAACPYGAISSIPPNKDYEGMYIIDETICWEKKNCIDCTQHFDTNGCLVAKSLYSYGESNL